MSGYDRSSGMSCYFEKDFIDSEKTCCLNVWFSVDWLDATHEFCNDEYDLPQIMNPPQVDMSLNEEAMEIQDFFNEVVFDNCKITYGIVNYQDSTEKVRAFPSQLGKLFEKIAEIVETLHLLIVPRDGFELPPTPVVAAVPIPGTQPLFWKPVSHSRRGTCCMCVETWRFKRSITCHVCNVLICMSCVNRAAVERPQFLTGICPGCRSDVKK